MLHTFSAGSSDSKDTKPNPERGREGGREGGRERGKEGGKEGGREGGREGGKEGGKEGGREEETMDTSSVQLLYVCGMCVNTNNTQD